MPSPPSDGRFCCCRALRRSACQRRPGQRQCELLILIAALSRQASAAASLCALASLWPRCVVRLSARQRCQPRRALTSCAFGRSCLAASTCCRHAVRASPLPQLIMLCAPLSSPQLLPLLGLPALWLVKLRALSSPQFTPPPHLQRCGSSSCARHHRRSLSRCVHHHCRRPCHRLACQCVGPFCCVHRQCRSSCPSAVAHFAACDAVATAHATARLACFVARRAVCVTIVVAVHVALHASLSPQLLPPLSLPAR